MKKRRMARMMVVAIVLALLSAATVTVSETIGIPAEHRINGVPLFRQGKNECGPTVVSMVLNYHGFPDTKEDLKTDLLWHPLKGVKTVDMANFRWSKYGLNADVLLEGNLTQIENSIAGNQLVIARQWSSKKSKSQADVGHWILVIGYNREKSILYINDPNRKTLREASYEEFADLWDMRSHRGNPSKNYMIIITKN